MPAEENISLVEGILTDRGKKSKEIFGTPIKNTVDTEELLRKQFAMEQKQKEELAKPLSKKSKLEKMEQDKTLDDKDNDNEQAINSGKKALGTPENLNKLASNNNSMTEKTNNGGRELS